jgi:hypothetical protein
MKPVVYEDILTACYPEGVPEMFPVDLFEPVEGVEEDAFVVRDLALQDRINALEDIMETMPQADLPVDHKFADGVYVRSLFMPKGATVTGRLHLRECVNIMVSGDITLLTVDGPVRLQAPQMFISAAGTKKIGRSNI